MNALSRRLAPCLVVSLSLAAAACANGAAVVAEPAKASPPPVAVPPAAVAPPAAKSAASGIDLAGIDRAVTPGDDFFALRERRVAEEHGDPGGPQQLGHRRRSSQERTAKRTAELIAEAAKQNAPAGSDARKIGDYYASFMDEATIETKGLAPLEPTLAAIAAIKDGPSLARYLGGTLRADVDVLNATNLDTDNLFGLWVAQDLDEPAEYAPFLLQGGLELPDRDYYLAPTPRMAEIRAKYQAHIASVLELAEDRRRRRPRPRASSSSRRRSPRPTRAARTPRTS